MVEAPNITDEDSFKAWLNSHDKETTAAYAPVLAGRVALRVLPNLHEIWDGQAPVAIKIDLTVQSLRCHIISGVARKYPTPEMKQAADSAFSALSAADSAFSAAFSAARSAARSAADIWQSVQADAMALHGGMAPEALEKLPLWQEGAPDWFVRARNDLRRALQQDGPHWDFWLDWFAAKAAGEPMERLGIAGEDFIGKKLAEQDNAFWDAGAEAVGKAIDGWIGEWEAQEKSSKDSDGNLVLPQNPVGAQFFVNDQEQMDVIPLPPEDRLLDTPQNREEYEDLRDIAQSLLDEGQILGPIAEPLAKFSGLMEQDLSHVSARLLWKGGMHMRRLLKMHDAVKDDPDYHPSKLDKACVIAFTDFINQLNIYFSADPILRQRDSKQISPQDRLSLAEQESLIQPMLDEILEGVDWASETAIEELKPWEGELPDGMHRDQVDKEKALTRQNFFAGLLTAFRQKLAPEAQVIVVTGAYDALKNTMIGISSNWPQISSFLIRHGESLVAYVTKVFSNPKFVEMIEFLLK